MLSVVLPAFKAEMLFLASVPAGCGQHSGQEQRVPAGPRGVEQPGMLPSIMS